MHIQVGPPTARRYRRIKYGAGTTMATLDYIISGVSSLDIQCLARRATLTVFQ